jgi:hypothetical protein
MPAPLKWARSRAVSQRGRSKKQAPGQLQSARVERALAQVSCSL